MYHMKLRQLMQTILMGVVRQQGTIAAIPRRGLEDFGVTRSIQA